MKLNGAVIPPPEPVKVQFYRSKTVVKLLVQAVLSFEEFDRLCPIPKPPLITNVVKKIQYHDFNDKVYQKKLDDYSSNKSSYIIIKGLEATDGLEWETVKINEPDTWKNWRKDLLTCFTESEISTIIETVNEANNPTEKRLTEAFDSFIPPQDQQPEKELSSLEEGQPATEPGVPASVSG